MDDMILHHYWGSPFAEKIRCILGYKGAEWLSLETRPVPPRPSLQPILGEFRRTPVLQIGADFFCDSRLIAEVIDQRLPERRLSRPSHRALDDLVTGWVEPRAFAMTGSVRFTAVEDVDGVFQGAVAALDFQADRLPFMAPAVEAARFALVRESAEDHLRAYLGVVEGLLEDGQPFLGGEEPCRADFSFYHLVWWLRTPPARDELLHSFPRLRAAADRVRAFGHGTYRSVAATDGLAALGKAQGAERWQGWDEREDRRMGRRVSVQPDDYGRIPVSGLLVASSTKHIGLEVAVEGVGTARVHFPRLGYEITATP